MVKTKKNTKKKEPRELEIFKNHLTKIILQIGKYKGKERLDVRQWVAVEGPNSTVDKWIPTKSGISIPMDLVPEFKEIVTKIRV